MLAFKFNLHYKIFYLIYSGFVLYATLRNSCLDRKNDISEKWHSITLIQEHSFQKACKKKKFLSCQIQKQCPLITALSFITPSNSSQGWKRIHRADWCMHSDQRAWQRQSKWGSMSDGYQFSAHFCSLHYLSRSP